MSRHLSCQPGRAGGRGGRTVRAALACAALLTGTSPLAAQTATVGGTLINHESKSPVEAARVNIIGTGLVASSDAQGRFQITGVPAGVRVMQVHAIGFSIGSWVVQLTDGQNLNQTFDLSPRTLEVEGVTVTGLDDGTNWRSEQSFEQRRQRGHGFFITRAQIEQRNALNMADLLRTVPGVMTTCSNGRNCVVRMERSTRQCQPEYFLDGYPATFSTGPNFPVQQIRGVEIYRDYFEVPAEFQRPNLQCGVIAIWTVEPGTPLGRH